MVWNAARIASFTGRPAVMTPECPAEGIYGFCNNVSRLIFDWTPGDRDSLNGYSYAECSYGMRLVTGPPDFEVKHTSEADWRIRKVLEAMPVPSRLMRQSPEGPTTYYILVPFPYLGVQITPTLMQALREATDAGNIIGPFVDSCRNSFARCDDPELRRTGVRSHSTSAR